MFRKLTITRNVVLIVNSTGMQVIGEPKMQQSHVKREVTSAMRAHHPSMASLPSVAPIFSVTSAPHIYKPGSTMLVQASAAQVSVIKYWLMN